MDKLDEGAVVLALFRVPSRVCEGAFDKVETGVGIYVNKKRLVLYVYKCVNKEVRRGTCWPTLQKSFHRRLGFPFGGT